MEELQAPLINKLVLDTTNTIIITPKNISGSFVFLDSFFNKRERTPSQEYDFQNRCNVIRKDMAMIQSGILQLNNTLHKEPNDKDAQYYLSESKRVMIMLERELQNME